MSNDLKKPLLPPRPPVLPPSPPLPPNPVRPTLAPPDLILLKKRGLSIRTWLRIDSKGVPQLLELDKVTIMRRCELPARDLRLLDPVFVYPSTILGREKAIVVNLESIRCVITADEVYLLWTEDKAVQDYKDELIRRINSKIGLSHLDLEWKGDRRQTLSEKSSPVDIDKSYLRGANYRRGMNDQDIFGNSQSPADDLPFEFIALELALDSACSQLDGKGNELANKAYPLLEQLAFNISTRNLELVRRLKSDLVTLTRRVQKVRDEIEQLMDDDGDMAEMYLTEKKLRAEMSNHTPHSDAPFGSLAAHHPIIASVSAPVSPSTSPTEHGIQLKSVFTSDRRFLNRTSSFASHPTLSTTSDIENVEELEMLLEAYFVVIDSTLNKLSALSQYIDNTEDFINIQLDNVRNQLIKFDLLMTTATFMIGLYSVVAGVFGMNIPNGLEENETAFKWVIIITTTLVVVFFCLFLMYFKMKNLTGI